MLSSFPRNCALERLLEEKEATVLAEEDVVGLEFTTVEAAEIFYQKYAIHVGFGVRRDDMRYDEAGVVVLRR